jgi:hypothetical protein
VFERSSNARCLDQWCFLDGLLGLDAFGGAAIANRAGPQIGMTVVVHR